MSSNVHGPALGRVFEDFALGDVYRHPLGRTITEADNTWFTLLTMNTNQNHFNEVYASRLPVGNKIIVNSGLTVAIVLGMSVIDVSQNAIVNLGWTDIKMTHPVFVGDTLFAESKVTGLRESSSRPYAGIITCLTRGLNQDGDQVISWERSVMVHRADSPQVAEQWFPETSAVWDE